MDKNIIIVILIAVVCILCGVIIGGVLHDDNIVVINETRNITNNITSNDTSNQDNVETENNVESSSKSSSNDEYEYTPQYGWYKETPDGIIDSKGNVLPREEDKW